MTTAIVNRKELKKALEIVKRAIPVKTTVPAIQNVRLSAENGTLEVAATDLEHTVRIPVARLKGKGRGVALLPARTLLAHVATATSDTVAFEWSDDDDKNVVTVGAAKIVGIAPADYPELPDFKRGKAVKMHGADFAAAVTSTKFAVSDEVVRYALMGLFLEVKGRKAHFVTSDGKRLAHRPVRCSGPAGGVIITTTTADLVSRLVKATPDVDVVIVSHKKDHKVSIRVGDARVLARIIDGNFPDWRSVIPTDREKAEHAELSRTGLLAAVEQMIPGTTERMQAARFTFRPRSVELFARAPDVGEATAKMFTVNKAPALGNVVLNPYYIIDYLKALPKEVETVRVYPNGSGPPVLFRAPDDHEYVLMPLTVSI